MNDLAKQALELCWEIEKFPASEHQTATVTKASALHAALERLLAGQQEPIAAPPVQEAARDWQPIATAPKTGEHILVAEFNPDRIGFGFCGGKKQSMMTVAHWWDNPGEEGWYASVDSQGEYPFPATHWKPLEELET